MTAWKEFPLNRPDPGWYLVAIRFHGQITYDVAEWKCGEWIRVFDDDLIVAFQPIDEFVPAEASAPHARGWHQYPEEKPEKNGDYLVAWQSGEMTVCRYSATVEELGGISGWHNFIICPPPYWRDLPEGPEK